MRIPLFRSGGDETPIAWWEWLFAPIMMPLSLLFLLARMSRLALLNSSNE